MSNAITQSMGLKVFSSALSTNRDWQTAVEEISAKINSDLNGRLCHLAIIFVSEAYRNFDLNMFRKKLVDMTRAGFVIATNSSGVIANEREVEMRPAIAVLAMHLPGVSFTPFEISPDCLQGLKNGTELIQRLDIYPTDRPSFLLCADPLSCNINKLLDLFNEGYPERPMIGGLASGTAMGTQNWMMLREGVYRKGAVGIALTGNIQMEIVVAQGCRPIGQPFVITRIEDNTLLELAGRPALEVLREEINSLSPAEQRIVRHSLFIGIAMDERHASFKKGDFLIRNIMGVDHELRALVVGERLKPGQTIQFQLRDANTSKEDLISMLETLTQSSHKNEGALLVSCCGRGQSLYGHPDHDAALIQKMRGPIPLAGLFANGEFGPICQKNYIHGYTSSLTIFR